MSLQHFEITLTGDALTAEHLKKLNAAMISLIGPLRKYYLTMTCRNNVVRFLLAHKETSVD